jgi:hypothetical protein
MRKLLILRGLTTHTLGQYLNEDLNTLPYLIHRGRGLDGLGRVGHQSKGCSAAATSWPAFILLAMIACD